MGKDALDAMDVSVQYAFSFIGPFDAKINDDVVIISSSQYCGSFTLSAYLGDWSHIIYAYLCTHSISL